MIAAACLATAGALAQRELFNRDRQIEIRDVEMNRLHALVGLGERKLAARDVEMNRLHVLVELGERKLAAEEILLRSLRAHLMKKDAPAK